MPNPTIARKLKQAVAERAAHQCEYCRSRQDDTVDAFSSDHLLPKSKGGTTNLENLAFACQTCNNHKYNKQEGVDPETRQVAPLFHPRQQRWREHFAWSEDTTRIIGLTPTGRATVYTLDMNRERLINLRGALYRDGKHPPQE